MGTSCKNIYILAEYTLRISTAEETVTNQADTLEHSSQMMVRVFAQSAISRLSEETFKQNGHGSREGGYTCAQQRGLSPSRGHLGNTIAKCLICQEQGTALSLSYGTIPRGDELAIWWQVDYTGSLPSWKEQRFTLIGMITYSGNGFAFTAHKLSASSTLCELTRCLISPASVCSSPHHLRLEGSFHREGINWVGHTHHWEAAGLNEW